MTSDHKIYEQGYHNGHYYSLRYFAHSNMYYFFTRSPEQFDQLSGDVVRFNSALEMFDAFASWQSQH